jgi:hypothetical protein
MNTYNVKLAAAGALAIDGLSAGTMALGQVSSFGNKFQFQHKGDFYRVADVSSATTLGAKEIISGVVAYPLQGNAILMQNFEDYISRIPTNLIKNNSGKRKKEI